MRRRRRRSGKRFPDLPVSQRAGIVLLGAVELSLLVAAELDIQRRPSEEINGSKLRWRLICLINVAGPLGYFRWGRR